MSRPIRLVTVLAVLLLVAGCSTDNEPARSDGDLSTAEQLNGTWHDVPPSLFGYYFTFDEEGIVDTYFTSNIDGSPDQWGTYTLNGDTLTMIDAPDAPFCRGAVSVWTVAFSPNGDKTHFTFASDSCAGTPRGTDWTLVRQSP
jgi:hypothetical protein